MSYNVGILGTHVERSLSPAMHNTAYAKMGLADEFQYGRFPSYVINSGDPEERAAMLGDHLDQLAEQGVISLSVTMPYKREVLATRQIQIVNSMDTSIGAVNTLNLAGESLWRGWNTDWIGAMASLEEAGAEIADKTALVLGAGGTARAVAFGFAQRKAGKIIIANRTLDNAVELAHDLGEYDKTVELEVVPLADRNILAEVIGDADIIYNTTSVGQNGTSGEGRTPIPAEHITPGTIVSDAVYMPIETPLLKAIRDRKGIVAIDGTRMLLHQAAEQVRLFTGEDSVPLEAMARALRDEIDMIS